MFTNVYGVMSIPCEMMKNHPRTRCMVFMTKTEGIGPKTQRMLEKLASREYQEKQIMNCAFAALARKNAENEHTGLIGE